jgi:hypothetical protein
MRQSKWITRKEIAKLSDLSVDIIRRNEQRLGLDRCKVTFNERILYVRQDAIAALIECRVIEMTGTEVRGIKENRCEKHQN